MTQETNNAKLFAKIAKVMSLVRTLEKTGENKFDKYDYVTADAIAIRIGKVLADVGLAFLPSLVSLETSEYQTKNGGTNYRTVAHFQMTLACTETGATFTSLWSGEAIDRSDKSISKAAVSAVKYYLLKTFLLAGGDEEDADASSPVVETRQAAQKAATGRKEAPVDGDALFEPTTPMMARINPEQAAIIAHLGKVAYPTDWDANKDKLAQWASKGARNKLGELYEVEAESLIKALNKKVADANKAQTQPVEQVPA